MDDTPDPIHQFFPSLSEEETSSILYKTLNLSSTASSGEIRSAYRKLALKYHPDKQSTKSQDERDQMGKEFQKVGFAYAVLSDDVRRKRYDTTGRTDENAFSDAEAMGWDAYFESLFQRIDRKILDEDKKKYQGSEEEIEDIKSAYVSSAGSLTSILEHIPHSNHTDEPRIIKIVDDLISSGSLDSTKKWETTSKDTTSRDKRKRKGEKEAKEAEKAAKELGVWDEFYGSGEKGKRKGESSKGKGSGGGSKGKADSNGEDALAALIQRRQKEREGGFDALAEKYARIEEEERAKKRAKKGKGGKKDPDEEEVNGTTEEMTDEQFAALQAKMFGAKEGKKDKKGVKP